MTIKDSKYVNTIAQKMKFSVKDFFSKCDQIRSFLWIWSHSLKKFLPENFIFCALNKTTQNKHKPISRQCSFLFQFVPLFCKNFWRMFESNEITVNICTKRAKLINGTKFLLCLL